MRIRLFLSAVTDEFGSYRETLRRDLERPNISIQTQEDFVAWGADTLEKLDDYIRGCDAPPGVGKTHLSVALGREAILAGYTGTCARIVQKRRNVSAGMRGQIVEFRVRDSCE
jgi:hypothetical protein